MKKIIKLLKRPLYRCILILTVAYIFWGNKSLVLKKYNVSNENIPKSFNGYKIIQVSDLHNDKFGKDNIKLINMIKESKPDIITITGDVVDSRRTNINTAINFVDEAIKIAPVYYITGNHESRVTEDFEILENSFNELGVTTLRGENISLHKGNETIQLIGIDDFNYYKDDDYKKEDKEKVFNKITEHIKSLKKDDSYSILLTHRPALFDYYVKSDVNLILAGHTHGGQFRIPFIGGIYASNSLFPKLDAGMFTKDNSTIIISRGLGNSLFPFRLNNRPEVVLVELENKNIK